MDYQQAGTYIMQFFTSIMLCIWSLDPNMFDKVLYEEFYYLNMLCMIIILFVQLFIDKPDKTKG